jgi:uncharacterized protein YcfL
MNNSEDVNEALEIVNRHSFSHPTVRKACLQLGISQEELAPKPLNDFLSFTNTKALAEVYFKHHEARRKAKLVLVGKFILEKKFASGKTTQIVRSLSSSSARPEKINSPKYSWNKNFQLIKKNLVKKLKVAKNIKNLKAEEEKKKKMFEEKLLEKSCRSDRKTSPDKRMKFERHDLRIKEILEKKQKELEEYEKRAISSMSAKREVMRTQTSSFNTQRKKQSRVLNKQLPEIDIDQKLIDYDRKMTKSTEIAKKALIAKTSSSTALVKHVNQVRAAKERIELKNEQKNIEKIKKISNTLMESSVKLIRNEEKHF